MLFTTRWPPTSVKSYPPLIVFRAIVWEGISMAHILGSIGRIVAQLNLCFWLCQLHHLGQIILQVLQMPSQINARIHLYITEQINWFSRDDLSVEQHTFDMIVSPLWTKQHKSQNTSENLKNIITGIAHNSSRDPDERVLISLSIRLGN